jgi:hypothetical protein
MVLAFLSMRHRHPPSGPTAHEASRRGSLNRWCVILPKAHSLGAEDERAFRHPTPGAPGTMLAVEGGD